MMRGVVVEYDRDRGFGFIRSRAFPQKDVFVHASTIVGSAPLTSGQRVQFEAESSEKGPRATRVQPGRRGLAPATAFGLGMVAVLALVAAGLRYESWPWVWAWLGAINPITFALYAWDKRRATLHNRRVPELVLLGLALIGGSPFAALAMGWLRHKTRKLTFLVPFCLIIVAQIAALGWWLSRGR